MQRIGLFWLTISKVAVHVLGFCCSGFVLGQNMVAESIQLKKAPRLHNMELSFQLLSKVNEIWMLFFHPLHQTQACLSQSVCHEGSLSQKFLGCWSRHRETEGQQGSPKYQQIIFFRLHRIIILKKHCIHEKCWKESYFQQRFLLFGS